MAFAFDSDHFRDAVLSTVDWQHFEKFKHFRDEDPACPRLLHRFESANSVNSAFDQQSNNGYTWLTERNDEIAYFHVAGFVTHVSIGPVNGGHADRVGARRYMQTITITGLGDSVFGRAVDTVNYINDFLVESGRSIKSLPSVSVLGGKFVGLTAMTRLMTPAEHKGGFSVISPIPSQLDVDGCMQNWVNKGDFVYTVDNQVDLVNMKGIENAPETWEHEADLAPSRICVGNLVEVLVSFRVAPFANHVKKVQCHLERITKISSEATSSREAVWDPNGLFPLLRDVLSVKGWKSIHW
ncbi:hypothetical protein GGX14DRAFT_402494 [Mycena pura]|uniref:Uncharacterized protein n=1 Tax=Mycena pura TaxID=153505 RepID=A0AAD6V0B0_9AGAR|nr:hypothetical protein GGX14DRAFT_402494 [Mycena pura]